MTIAGELINVLGFRLEGQENLKRFNQGMDDAADKVETSSKRIAGFAAAAGVSVGAVGYAMLDSLKASAKFETALTNIQKKGGYSALQMAALGTEIKDLATSGSVTAGPVAIAEAYERLAAAGIPLEDLREMAVLSVQTADAFEMTEEAAANAFAGFRTSLGMAKSELRPFADLINQLADSGIADERDIVSFVDRAGPAMKAAGFSNNEIAAHGATLLNGKFEPSKASTFMDAVTQKMMNPTATKKTTEAFSELYGTTAAWVDMVDQGADVALRDLWRRLGALKSGDRARVIQDIFGAEWAGEAQRAIALQEEHARNLAIASDPGQYMGSLGTSYALKLKTMEAQWAQFVAKFETAKIDFGLLLLPPAAGFLSEASEELMKLHALVKSIADTWTSFSNTDFSIKGLHEWLDVFGTHAKANAEQAAAASRAAVLSKDPGSGAAGRFGASDMSGVEAAMVMARRQGQRKDVPTFDLDAQKSANDERWERLRGQIDNMNSNLANMAGAAPIDAVITDARTDARSFPITTTVNVGGVHVQQPTNAPGAVGQAVGAAAANAVQQQASRLNTEPAN